MRFLRNCKILTEKTGAAEGGRMKVWLSVLMENDKLTPEIEDSPTERQIIRAYQSIWDMLSILSEDKSKCTVESAKILREEK